MNRASLPLGIKPAGAREHPIDNLEAAIASDTVDIEVNADFKHRPPLDDAGR